MEQRKNEKRETLTIVKVSVKDKNKEGKPYISKTGKPFFLVGIQTNEYGSDYLNGIMPFNPDKWEGSTQDLITFDEEYNGKVSRKFTLPPRENKGGGLSDDDRAAIKAAKEYAIAANTTANKCYVLLTGLVRDLTLSGVLKEHTSDGMEVPEF